MTAPTALDELAAWIDAFERADLLDGAVELPQPPALDGSVLREDELGRARLLLERLDGLGQRTQGQRTRIAGEIAGLPKRPRTSGHRRSPRAFDRTV